jgi:hypothetical protein
MKIICPLLLALLIATTCSAVEGDITDGNSLQENIRNYKRYVNGTKLKGDDVVNAIVTVGYFKGFIGGSEPWAQLDKTGCPYSMPRMPLTQLIQVVDKYLSDHPEQLHEPASSLMFAAVTTAFPNPDFRRKNEPRNDRG